MPGNVVVGKLAAKSGFEPVKSLPDKYCSIPAPVFKAGVVPAKVKDGK